MLPGPSLWLVNCLSACQECTSNESSLINGRFKYFSGVLNSGVSFKRGSPVLDLQIESLWSCK